MNRRKFLKSSTVGCAATSQVSELARRQHLREGLLPVAKQKQMGVIAMKVMGGGFDCLATDNPLQKITNPYYDQPHQVNASQLLRYSLGLPISLAVVGVASIEQLKANIAVVKENTPMRLTERQDLEELIA
jgi:uncharacterized protein